ncbi:MAG: M15 family metallopeptidase [Gammaproteobacteria bacterium]
MYLLMRFALALFPLFNTAEPAAAPLPPGFVYLDEIAPDIVLDLRYAGNENFVGTAIDGYVKPVAITTRKTAEALKHVESELVTFGLSLKVFDAYRPQRAVDHFVRWSKDWHDTRRQTDYYPNVAKKDLFREKYIAEKSGHSRGSTVDVTLVYRAADGLIHELDMGTHFDYFDPSSWPEYPALTASQRANRMLLRLIMEKHGFKPYPKEWWHFTLSQEPFPESYFNFTVE